MANRIQMKRGLRSKLTTLYAGEPAYTTDTREFFIGTGNGNVNMSGSQWYTGTAMRGTSTSTTYYYSGCPLVKLGDIYLNTDYGYIYQCTTAGNSTAARWTYKGSIRGADANMDSVASILVAIGVLSGTLTWISGRVWSGKDFPDMDEGYYYMYVADKDRSDSYAQICDDGSEIKVGLSESIPYNSNAIILWKTGATIQKVVAIL